MSILNNQCNDRQPFAQEIFFFFKYFLFCFAPCVHTAFLASFLNTEDTQQSDMLFKKGKQKYLPKSRYKRFVQIAM